MNDIIVFLEDLALFIGIGIFLALIPFTIWAAFVVGGVIPAFLASSIWFIFFFGG